MIVRNCCVNYVLCATAPSQGVVVSVSTYATRLFLNLLWNFHCERCKS